MLATTEYKKLLLNCKYRKSYVRYISKYLHKDRMSKSVRQKFLDYFIKENNHNFIRSSPVVPYCDPSVAFVNAGMNQFKGVLLGTQAPLYKRVANTQKCVRVGGKHNDLSLVGSDGYHHTFFEMLGNWSFGSYYKKEACELAWTLLTQVYNINRETLYVTYFKGNPALDLPPDLECKDIWKSLGVKEDRILGFGVEDNFWEMGPTGPCGPSTEIHVDLRGPTNRSKFVNKGLHDLTEIWNIVFIQYKRKDDGMMEKLPHLNIDTGMGFERLCALLQRKVSNYDTDLFTPIFGAIPKICKDVPAYNGAFGEKDWNNLHTNYRILADHTRMLTVCLSDGMIPESNQKLRRVMRKSFLISDSVFKQDSGLVRELSNYVVDTLGEAYPELDKNLAQVHQIIEYEEDLYHQLRSTSSVEWRQILEKEPTLAELDVLEMPGLLGAYKSIKSSNVREISPAHGFKLYDTFGLDEDSIVKLATCLNLPLDVKRFRDVVEASKVRLKEVMNVELETLAKKFDEIQLPATNDTLKYKYWKVTENYVFEGVEAKVLAIIKAGRIVDTVEPNEDCIVVFDKTPLYCESGGQDPDRGYAVYNDGIFEISEVEDLSGRILHKGKFKSTANLSVGNMLKVNVDSERRLKNMRNHTATHLLNSTLKKLKGATCQKSSKVTDQYLSFDVGIFGEKLTVDDIRDVEKHIADVIKEAVIVKTSEIDSQELLTRENITLVPGETYPESGIRFVEVLGRDTISREPCCGTHVLNTSDILDFCVVNVKSLGRSTTSILAVTGLRAKVVRESGMEIIDDITKLKKNIDDNMDKPEIFDNHLMKLKHNLASTKDNADNPIPFVVRQYCLNELEEINKKLKAVSRNTLKEFVEMEMKSVLESQVLRSKSNKNFIVHYLRSSMVLKSIPLQKATRLCPHTPVLVISYANNMVKARCCVPENMITKDFNAQIWVGKVSAIFKSIAQPPNGQNPSLVCNMKAKHVSIQDWDTLLKESLNVATVFAEENL